MIVIHAARSGAATAAAADTTTAAGTLFAGITMFSDLAARTIEVELHIGAGKHGSLRHRNIGASHQGRQRRSCRKQRRGAKKTIHQNGCLVIGTDFVVPAKGPAVKV